MDLSIKRLFNEITELLKSNTDIRINLSKTQTEIIVGKITFIAFKNYPFEKPKLLINGDITYVKWLRSPTNRICVLLAKKGIKCMCCSTILCEWTPTYTISKLMSEITDMNLIKREVKYRILLYDALFQKTNIDPNRIIHYIMQFLL
jgi:hypothetical protein